MSFSEENLKAFAATNLRIADEKERIGDVEGASTHLMHAAQYFIQLAGVAKNSLNVEYYKKMANDLITKLEGFKKKPTIPDIPNNTIVIPDEKRRAIEKEILNLLGMAFSQKQQVVKLGDIGGLDVVLQQIKDCFLPTQRPNLFSERIKPWNGILIYGPAGTGKTSLAQAVATEVGSAFFFVSSMEVMTRSVNICEEFLGRMFALAREKKPSIVFLDNVDRLALKNSGKGINEQLRAMHVDAKIEFNESEDEHCVAVELAKQLEGMVIERDRVFLLAATNSPWDIDLPVLRKFEKRIYIPLPDVRARNRIFRIQMANNPHHIDDDGFSNLANHSEGYTGKDIELAVRTAALYAFRPLESADCFKPFSVPGPAVGSLCIKYVPCAPNELGAKKTTLNQLKAEGLDVVTPPITIENIMEALSKTKKTVTEADITQFEAWTKENGGR